MLGSVYEVEGHRLAIGCEPGTWVLPLAAQAGIVVLRTTPATECDATQLRRVVDHRGRVRLTHGEADLLGPSRVLVCRPLVGAEVIILTGGALVARETIALLASVLGCEPR
jgi:hypothetical protein